MHNVGILFGSMLLASVLIAVVSALVVYRRPPPPGLPSLVFVVCIIFVPLLGGRGGFEIGTHFQDPYGFEPIYGAINGWVGSALGSGIGYPIGHAYAMWHWWPAPLDDKGDRTP